MKNSRFKFKYRANASQLHCIVGDCLRNSSFFKQQEIYQEYPVNRVNTKYPNAFHHFDWVIPKLKIVIECHGEQHFKPVAFDGNIDKMVENFKQLLERDKLKKEAAQIAGYKYIVLSYLEQSNINEELIMYKLSQAEEASKYEVTYQDQIEELADDQWVEQMERKKSQNKIRYKEFLNSEEYQRKLSKAKSYRRRQYQRAKELKKRNDNDK